MDTSANTVLHVAFTYFFIVYHVNSRSLLCLLHTCDPVVFRPSYRCVHVYLHLSSTAVDLQNYYALHEEGSCVKRKFSFCNCLDFLREERKKEKKAMLTLFLVFPQKEKRSCLADIFFLKYLSAWSGITRPVGSHARCADSVG